MHHDERSRMMHQRSHMPQLRLDVAEEIIFFFWKKSSCNLSKNLILMIISILQMKEMKQPEIMDSVPGHRAGKLR